ncbi:dynamin family protein [Providencia stuartii]|uniref:dynamin family protein n=1 Tax=Providencia stuartii TaxID=588 RepID=UPI0034E57FFC
MSNKKRSKKKQRVQIPKSLESLATQKEFEVIVLATMSAGKSTLINALIGTELLPSSNQACTARIFKIENHDGMQGFQAGVTSKATSQPSHWINASPETLQQLNDSDEEGVIIIHGDMKSISNQGLRLSIFDTPGPNNSQDKRHSQMTNDILNDGNFGLVLYVLNATQIGVEDDALLLQDLFFLNKNKLDDKEIVFVLNKADKLDEEQNEDLGNIVKEVETYLERHGFKAPIVIPLSSIAALLARKVQHHEPLTRKEKRNYHGLLEYVKEENKPLYTYAKLPEVIKNKLRESSEELTDTNLLVMYSGVTAIEYLIHEKLVSSKEKISFLNIDVTRKDSLIKRPELKIVYNPFSVKTSFLLDGKQGYLSELEKKAKGKRIQQWIHDIFTPDLFDKTINGNELDFVFEGSDVEVEDVREAVNAFNREYGGRYKLYADYITHPLQTVQKIRLLCHLFAELQSGPFDTFRSPEMHQAFEKALSSEFEITVLATMSAGKSTVINAMVGKELLPSKNQACTATIARVINDDAMTEFEVRRLGENDVILDDWQIVTDEEQFELITQWNEDKDTSTIELKGNIPAINARDGIKMVLVETPGPNNSNDASHRVAMERAIKSNQQSMVLYVLNRWQLGISDDQSLLYSIKMAMSKGGREAHDRFVFIINKIDILNPSYNESVASVLSNVKQYLEDNGLINPVVIPVSAELTKLIRIKRFRGEDALTRKQKRDLNILIEQFVEEDDMNLLEHSRHDLPVSVYQKLKQQVDEARHQHDDETLAELLSGIPIIEALLDDYLIKHAVPSRIKDAVQLFETVAHEQDIKQKLDAVLSMSK